MTKPALHSSMLGMLSKCGEQARLRYVEGRKGRPSVPMIVGTAVHRASDLALSRKVAGQELPSVEEVRDAAGDAFERTWRGDDAIHNTDAPDGSFDGEDVLLSEDERDRGLTLVRAEAKDDAVRLAQVHREVLAPRLQPIAVERRMRLVLDGFPFDIEGTIDVQEVGTIRDLKNVARSPSGDEANGHVQLDLYALACEAIDGKPLRRVALDFLVKLKTPKHVESIAPAPRDHTPILRRLERAAHVFEKQAFYPADPTGPSGWVCTSKFCPWFDHCDFGRKRKRVI